MIANITILAGGVSAAAASRLHGTGGIPVWQLEIVGMVGVTLFALAMLVWSIRENTRE